MLQAIQSQFDSLTNDLKKKHEEEFEAQKKGFEEQIQNLRDTILGEERMMRVLNDLLGQNVTNIHSAISEELK